MVNRTDGSASSTRTLGGHWPFPDAPFRSSVELFNWRLFLTHEYQLNARVSTKITKENHVTFIKTANLLWDARHRRLVRIEVESRPTRSAPGSKWPAGGSDARSSNPSGNSACQWRGNNIHTPFWNSRINAQRFDDGRQRGDGWRISLHRVPNS